MIDQWDAYSTFLHHIGHIMGFRHEHPFLSTDQRKCLSMGKTPPSSKIVDKNSIMSYGYLSQFTKEGGETCKTFRRRIKHRQLDYMMDIINKLLYLVKSSITRTFIIF